MDLNTIDPVRAASTAERLRIGVTPLVQRADVETVARWAQRGEGARATVRAALARLIRGLYLPPANRRADWMRVRIARPTDRSEAELATLLLAARGRLRLATEQTILPSELAALAGYTDRHVRELVEDKRLRRTRVGRTHAPITRASAVQLLGERGVPPFAPNAS